MTHFKKLLSLALALIMLLSVTAVFSACGETQEGPDVGQTGNSSINAEDESAEEDHRFDGVNYNGREFRIYTSTNISTMGKGNSNFLIEGTGETDGGLVNDAVLERNIQVEDLLGVELAFTQIDLNYDKVAGDIRRFTTSGTDEFDLVINDIYAYAELLIEGNFRNVLDDDCVFDFDRPYWYKDYMDDLRLMDGYQYVLAGDYFIDILRDAHLLLLNKQIYLDHYNRSADELYDVVTNFEWTYEKMNEVITDMYTDKNLNGTKDKGDQFGFMEPEFWGGSIPFSVSGNPTFISRDEDGVPTVVLHEGDRANQLANAMSTLFNNESASVNLTGDVDLLTAFTQDECLIVGYQRLGSLENAILRQMEGDAAVLPYPMLFASDKKYTTSAHDTTEMGAILATSTDLAFISTVVEVLNCETSKILIPVYYKECLQVQCVDDEKAAAIIDIIHDNFDNSFILAYNLPLGSVMLQAFAEAMQSKREFSAVYAGKQKAVDRALQSKIRTFEKKNNVG
ncbi:MAG: hypothetical protein J6K29_10815 [Clostridia bacterium]|nr:hypothetical protein [Clostridia bacterium]